MRFGEGEKRKRESVKGRGEDEGTERLGSYRQGKAEGKKIL